MPKDRRNGLAKARESRSRPYKARGKGLEGDSVSNLDVREDWEDALCPICFEAPHNAVLLVCSSYANGCRPYMCNTSHRHSNCLDQFQKSQVGLQKSQSPLQAMSISEGNSQQMVVDTFHGGNTLNVRIVDAYPVPPPTNRPARAPTTLLEHAPADNTDVGNTFIEALNSRMASADLSVMTRRSRRRALHPPLPHFSREEEAEAPSMHFLDSEAEGSEGSSSSLIRHPTVLVSSAKNKLLSCPLCRGQIFGWRVINAARKYFNCKARNCAYEACAFAGTYQELRVHARSEHPCALPREVDPAQERDWLRMERQREIGDVLSTIGASSEDTSNEDGQWWSYLFLLHFFRPVNEDGFASQFHDHRQHAGLQRSARESVRHLIENMNRFTDEASMESESRTEGEQSTSRPLNRQLRRRRGLN